METADFSFPILRASSILSEIRHKKLGARICNLLENKNPAHSAQVQNTIKNIPPRGMS
jgi:hypothetical protein